MICKLSLILCILIITMNMQISNASILAVKAMNVEQIRTRKLKIWYVTGISCKHFHSNSFHFLETVQLSEWKKLCSFPFIKQNLALIAADEAHSIQE